MKMKRIFLLLTGLSLIGLLLSGCTIHIDTNTGCNFSAPRTASIDLDKAKLIKVNAASGSLQILGKPGLTAVRATGTACASSKEGLDRIQLETRAVGDAVEINVETTGAPLANQTLDLTLEVPDNIPLQVNDPSGTATIRQVKSVALNKGSGETDLSSIGGDVAANTKSGTFTVSHVLGNVILSAGSGTLTVRDIAGDLTISDKASGETLVEQVDKNVTLGDLGSGTLTVHDVGGELKLAQKASGSITLSDVQGNLAATDLGSGEAYLHDVKGNVAVEHKSSGTMTIATVGGSVAVGQHDSGTLEVRDVKGDLTVKSKGSGRIETSNISGKIQVPSGH